MSLRRLAPPTLPVPKYSTLSRKAKVLRVTLPVLRNADEAVHLLVDSTGIEAVWRGRMESTQVKQKDGIQEAKTDRSEVMSRCPKQSLRPLTEYERQALQRIVRSGSKRADVVAQAREVLAVALGAS